MIISVWAPEEAREGRWLKESSAFEVPTWLGVHRSGVALGFMPTDELPGSVVAFVSRAHNACSTLVAALAKGLSLNMFSNSAASNLIF